MACTGRPGLSAAQKKELWGRWKDSQSLSDIGCAANIQDRDGGVMLMAVLFGLFPFLLKLYADSGYREPKFQEGLRPNFHSV